MYHCDSLLFPNDDDDTAATDNDDDSDLNLDAPWVKLVTIGGSGAVGDVSHVRLRQYFYMLSTFEQCGT